MVETQTRTDREQELWLKAVEKYNLGMGKNVTRLDLVNWNMLVVKSNSSMIDKSTKIALSVFTYEDKEIKWSKTLSKGFESVESVQGYMNELKGTYGDE